MAEKGSVIIIDDVARNIQVVASILREEGYRVAYAQNGPDGLTLLRESSFDLVLLDIMMPDMDGYVVCRQILSDPFIENVPVIFITAKGEQADIVRGLEVGAVDYISKPFNPAELVYRVRTHVELKQARDKLKELNSIKDRFNSIMVHDIKNAFHAIMGLAEVMQTRFEDSSRDEQLQYINTIYSSSHRLYELLENILEWSKLQMGNVVWWPRELSLHKITRETISSFRANAEEKGIEIVSRIDESAVAWADEHMVRSIFRNLFSNALKFTEAGGTVEVSCDKEGSMVRISITDTGTGMSPDILESLFQFTEKGTMPGTARERGTGIGLILTREQVNMNQGEIKVESRAGEGTTVSFTLPLDTGEVKKGSKEAGVGIERRPLRILLLDIDGSRPRECNAIFEGRMINVDEIALFSEALSALEVVRYDMVVIAEAEDRMTCLEAIAEIRKRDMEKGTHTLIVGLCREYAKSRNLKQAGVDEVILYEDCIKKEGIGERLLYLINKRGRSGD